MSLKTTITFDTSEWDEVMARLRDFDPSIPLEAAAQELAGEIREVTPVKTGALKASIDVTVEGDQVTAGSDLPYAGIVDERTGFLTNVTENEGPGILERKSVEELEDIVG